MTALPARVSVVFCLLTHRAFEDHLKNAEDTEEQKQDIGRCPRR